MRTAFFWVVLCCMFFSIIFLGNICIGYISIIFTIPANLLVANVIILQRVSMLTLHELTKFRCLLQTFRLYTYGRGCATQFCLYEIWKTPHPTVISVQPDFDHYYEKYATYMLTVHARISTRTPRGGAASRNTELRSYRNFPADYGKSYLSNMAVCDGFVRKTFTNLEIFLQKVRICQ
jgi:hypothetical protein